MPLDERSAIAAEAFQFASSEPRPGARLAAMAGAGPYLEGEALLASIDAALQSARPEVIAPLAQRVDGFWSHALGQAAIDSAKRRPGPAEQSESLSLLLPLLPTAKRDDIFDEAFAAACRDRTPYRRAEALSLLVEPATAEARPMVLDALIRELKSSVGGDWSPDRVLARVAPYLAGPSLEAALHATTIIADDRERVAALVALVPFVSQDTCRLMLEHAAAVGEEKTRSELLTSLADRVDERGVAAFVTLTRSIQWRSYAVGPLERLLPRVTEDRRAEVIDDLLRAANEDPVEGDRMETLARAIPLISPHEIDRAVWLARGIESDYWRARALLVLQRGTRAAVADSGIGRILDDALEAARATVAPSYLSELLSEAAVLSDSAHTRSLLFAEALATARAIPDRDTRATSLRLLSSRINDSEERRSLLLESLRDARGVESPVDRTEVLLPLIGDLPAAERTTVVTELRRAALEAGPSERARILSRLLDACDNDDAGLTQDALECCDQLGPSEGVRLLRSVLRVWTGHSPNVDAFVVACQGWDENCAERASLLLDLASRLAPPDRSRVINAAVDLVGAADGAVARAEVLAVVAVSAGCRARARAPGNTARRSRHRVSLRSCLDVLDARQSDDIGRGPSLSGGGLALFRNRGS